MGFITLPYTHTGGQRAIASRVMANLNALLNEINGLLDAANLENDAVTTVKILNAAVTAAKLATDAVETLKIKDAAVTTEKLADDSVTDDKLNADCAGAGLTQDGNGALQVNVDDSTIEVAADVVRVKDDGIDSEHLAAGGIDTEHIGNNQVTSGKVNMGQGLVDNANAIDVDGVVEQGTGAHELKFKEIDIGDWNMDLSPSVDIAHGLTWGDIVMVTAFVRADVEIGHAEPLTTPYITTGPGQFGETQGAIEWDATNVTLRRLASGTFDHTNYNSTSYNRGWILIVYKA